MVCHHTNCHIGLRIIAIADTCNLADLVEYASYRIDFKQIIRALHDSRDTLEAGTGIDVLLGEWQIAAVGLAIELSEHEVPKFDEAIAIAIDSAGLLTTALLNTAVIEELGTRAGRARAVLPEIIFLTEPRDTFFGESDHVVPDIVSFVIFSEDCNMDEFRLHLQMLRHKLPGPGDGIMLEIIAKAEITQHLEIRAVASRETDLLYIGCANTLLASRDAKGRRYFSTGKIRFERRHARIDQQDRRIIVRNQGETRHAKMPLRFEETQVSLAYFV